MTEHVDMSQFIAARSDQMNADDLLDGPRTITIIKVTASPDAAEQPVSIHYEGDGGKPFKPCKTVRRIMVGVWGKDASKYVGRSLTLYRDPTVAFGGMQVGGLRVSHMSHIEQDKTVALQVTRGRKAPFTVKPLKAAPAATDQNRIKAETWVAGFRAELGTFDADGQRALFASKATTITKLEQYPDLHQTVMALMPGEATDDFDDAPQTDAFGLAPVDEPHPAQPKADAVKAEIAAAKSDADIATIMATSADDIAAMPDELGASIEIAADKRRREIEATAKEVAADA